MGAESTNEVTITKVSQSRREQLVALIGNPNVGKSTLFNAITGSKQAVVNAPGTTVEVASGHWRGTDLRVLDLPGAYSLLARSPDEEITAQTMAGGSALGQPDLVVVVLDASALGRSLYLAAQMRRSGHPLVLALTMTDVAQTRGVNIDTAELGRQFNCPVVEIDPRNRRGLTALTAAVTAQLSQLEPARVPQNTTVSAPEQPEVDLTSNDARFADAEELFAWVAKVQRAVCPALAPVRLSRSDRVDRWLLRPMVGIPVFLVVLWGVLQLATAVAAPLMNAANWLVTTLLGGALNAALERMQAPSWVSGLLVDGVLAGVATVAAFAPMMALVFLAVGLLEDSGYLPRAAFVADRAMRHLGLDGRAVLPLVVGYGCNLAALAALRTLPNARQRLLTALLLPFTSCTARLTVYLMLATVFFPQHAGTVVFGLYLLSAAIVVLIGWGLRRTMFADLGREPLLLLMPAYQRPHLLTLGRGMWARVAAFVTGAGRVIVIAMTIIWLLMAVPVRGDYPLGEVPPADSVFGAVTTSLAPLFAPAGFGDWGTTAALLTGVIAKEVVVGTLVAAYGGESWSAGILQGLEHASGGHPAAAALAFLVFTLVYAPCLATLAELRRQIGWRWMLGSALGSTALAWVLAVVVFNVGRLL